MTGDGTSSELQARSVVSVQTSNWCSELSELERRQELARAMGGPENIARQHAAHRMTARERIDRLLDRGSFQEIGVLAGRAHYDSEGKVDGLSPANVVTGTGLIEGRKVVVAAEDFTVRGGSSEATSPEKWQYAERLALEYRWPMIRLVETAGGSVNLVRQMGATKLPGYPHWRWVDMLSTVPVVSAALGACAGFGARRVVSSHFSVMVKGTSQVFAGGPAVVGPGVNQEIDKEALGGSKVHAHGSGVVDNEALDESDALVQIRRILSFLPGSVFELPTRNATSDPADRQEDLLSSIVPRNRRRTYPMREIMTLIFDEDSIFEIGRFQGRSQITALARLDGWPVGVLANDPQQHAGALTAKSADKLIRFVDMCDTFHLPIVNLVDQPGTYVGAAAEQDGTVRMAIRAGATVDQTTVPWYTVIVRRCFGLAGAGYGPLRGANLRVAWPSAYWGSIPFEGGVQAAYSREIRSARDPEARLAELMQEFTPYESPFKTAEQFGIQDIINPSHTRPLLCAWVADAYRLLPEQLGKKSRGMRP